MPKVMGPITGGQKNRPFWTMATLMESRGYIEEEYFFSGVANTYAPVGELSDDGKWSVKVEKSTPYTTRMLVRRPRDASKFNGTVIVEWMNVSVGSDNSGVTDVYDGFAYAGISAQSVGVNGFEKDPKGLRAWDPVRYGSLSVPGESLSYDIFCQGAVAVGPNRQGAGVDPMGGLKVRKLIATGGSQSGARLHTYINALQPRDNVFDAFVPTVTGPTGSHFSDAVGTSSEDRTRVPTPPARIRSDSAVPVLWVNSETEAPRTYAYRQPDTDTFRYWEIAGSSHFNIQVMEFGAIGAQQNFGVQVLPDMSKNHVGWMDVADAALQRTHEWLVAGKLPRAFAPITFAAGSTRDIVRDQYGNATGGVRLPQLEVPIARYLGSNPNIPGDPAGVTEPFSAEKLKALYPTHADYVAKVKAAAEAAEKAGVILARCRARYVKKAEAEKVPA